MSDSKPTSDERLHGLERRANVIRSRLLRAVGALDARRHQVAKIAGDAKSIAGAAALTIAALTVLFGASALMFTLEARRRRRRSLSSRVSHAVQRLDLVRRPSFARRMVEKVAFTLATFAATELAKRASKNLVDGRLLDGRIAVGRALAEHHEDLAYKPFVAMPVSGAHALR